MIEMIVPRRRAFILAAIAFVSAAAGAAAQTKLVLQAAFPVPSVSLAAVYIADQAGFFKEEGLDVEIRFSSGGPQATQITASGGADLALVTIEPAIQGYEKGIRGKAFYRYYTRLPFFVAVPADSPMKMAADLAGKKLGVSNMASSTIVITKSTMRHAGISITDDAFLPVGVGDSALAALRSGQIRHAALDVFSTEPLPTSHPLAALPNVTLSAHAAWKSREASLRLLRESLRLAQADAARIGADLPSAT